MNRWLLGLIGGLLRRGFEFLMVASNCFRAVVVVFVLPYAIWGYDTMLRLARRSNYY